MQLKRVAGPADEQASHEQETWVRREPLGARQQAAAGASEN